MTPARQWRLHGPRDLRLERLKLTVPETGYVLVETSLSAVSVSTELSLYLGPVGPDRTPHVLGYQSTGRVLRLGPGTPTSWRDQRVVGTWGHTSHALIREDRLIAVPDSTSDLGALAVILGEESMKGVRKLNPPPRSQVLVVGAGLLGLLSVFNLVRLGHTVYVCEPVLERRELARRLGAAEVWRPDQAKHMQVHFALEYSASPEGFQELLTSMRPGGRVLVLSDGNWGRLVLSPEFHQKELTIMASSDGEDYAAYARWLWENHDPALEWLFEDSIPAPELAAFLPNLQGQIERPVSFTLRW